jgi:lipid-A-disaccharide synthase
MIGGRDELLVVAGEASGDLHGARLLAELRRLVPGLGAFGLGGGELRAAGLEAVADSSEVAVVGLVEVLKVLPRVREVFAALLAEVDLRRPRAAVLIDFPDFNLRLARQLKRRGIPVIYYISPQVWAWRRGRVRTIARRVDQMLVLFPFEVELYRRAGVPAVHVGHPLVDEVPRLASAWDRAPAPGEPLRLALLPGSRRGEIEALLLPMLAAAARLAAELPIAVSLIRAPAIPEQVVAAHLAAFAAGAGHAGGAGGLPVRVVSEERFAAIADSHLALCASGTATLEVGLLGTPMVVVYRLASWTYLLARLLVRLPNFALVNLVLGREVVPELLQGEAEPERIAAEALRLLADPEARGRQRAGLAELRPRLGEGGASARAARLVAALLARTAGGGREQDGAEAEGGAHRTSGAQEEGSVQAERGAQGKGAALKGRAPA